MTKILGCLMLAAMTFAVAPQVVLADEGVPIKASFAVAFSGTLNTGNVAYCGGTAGPVAIEAHGDGFSNIGALGFSLQKTQSGPLFHGCLTLTAPDGDTLSATTMHRELLPPMRITSRPQPGRSLSPGEPADSVTRAGPRSLRLCSIRSIRPAHLPAGPARRRCKG